MKEMRSERGWIFGPRSNGSIIDSWVRTQYGAAPAGLDPWRSIWS